MNIDKGVTIIDLALYVKGVLIISDTHIGYEEALNKQGVFVPRFQFKEIILRLESIFKKLKNKKIETIVINGDVKHEFGRISDQEWRHTLRLLDFLGRHCKEIILVKGNHDKIIGPIAEKRKVKVVEHYFINKEISIKKKSLKNLKFKNNKKILVIHGDKIPGDDILKETSVIIIGHEHPAVSVKEGPRVEVFKAYLKGKWKSKKLIVQPSFNLVTEGTNVLNERLLSPFLHQNLRNFDVWIAADKVYGFGKLKEF
ncbi:metallophosphoesterase family protein [Candidatus Woesearchaeota archaeon]|nr:metallophosphoesterase family protein [Candidatus Woesearchaeota archaeon]